LSFIDVSNTGDVFGAATFGDFYREPDEVVRGVTLDMGFTGFEEDQKGIDEVHKCGLKQGPTLTSAAPFAGRGARFQYGDVPPGRPGDAWFQLEATTTIIKDMSPVDLGNSLLDFLDEEVAAIITKLNRKKFSLKAEAFVDGLACKVKVRVYQQEGDAFAVEFQRRSGDCITFNHLYQQAKQFLKKRADPYSKPYVSENISMESLAFENTVGNECNDAIAQILEVAEGTQDRRFQAEVASSLAALARQNPGKAAQLCAQPAIDVLRQFLCSDCFSVVYPTACLLSSLSRCPEAARILFDQDILGIMIDKVWMESTGRPSWELLAGAVYRSVAQALTSGGLTEPLVRPRMEKLAAKLAESLDGRSGGHANDALICHEIQEALHVLTAQMN